MQKFYTGITTKDILTERGMLGALFDDALTDNALLRKMVAGLVDRKLLDAIACEYRRGRLLLIGTTNLDAQRDGIAYNLVSIPREFTPKPRETSDREYMQKLFDVGLEMGKKGCPWQKVPPAFADEHLADKQISVREPAAAVVGPTSKRIEAFTEVHTNGFD